MSKGTSAQAKPGATIGALILLRIIVRLILVVAVLVVSIRADGYCVLPCLRKTAACYTYYTHTV